MAFFSFFRIKAEQQVAPAIYYTLSIPWLPQIAADSQNGT